MSYSLQVSLVGQLLTESLLRATVLLAVAQTKKDTFS